MKYICPRCNSENILPMFPKDNLWKCMSCGFIGKPHTVGEVVAEFWDSFLMLSKQKPK